MGTKTNYVRLLLVLALLVGIFGCDKKADHGRKKMAVVISTLNNPWFVVLADSAAAKSRELGYKAQIFDSQNDSAHDAEHFDNIIAMGYDAILFNPTDADGSPDSALNWIPSPPWSSAARPCPAAKGLCWVLSRVP